MTTRSKAAKALQTKARNDRNYQERSLAAEMDVKPRALREVMDDVMVDDEHSVGFNQHAWDKLMARLPVSCLPCCCLMVVVMSTSLPHACVFFFLHTRHRFDAHVYCRKTPSTLCP